MNANDSLLNNFLSMREEFSSSNNRILRDIDRLFDVNLSDFLASLNYFNEEYVIIDIRDLDKEFSGLKESLENAKAAHVSKFKRCFDREEIILEQNMCGFFKNKLLKGDGCKRKMSCDIKKSLDKMCDFNVMGLEEEIDNIIYGFKVDFEMKYISNEYCKDDFNKIVRTFKHSLVNEIRDLVVNSVGEMQDIVSRYANKSYEIIDHYREMKGNSMKK